MMPQEDIRYFWHRYWRSFWFVRPDASTWISTLARFSFVLLVLSAAVYLTFLWGFTRTMETTEARKIPSASLANLFDLWFTPSGSLAGVQRQGWKVALWSWEPGNDSPGAPKTLDLDALTPKDEPPPGVVPHVRVPNLIGQGFVVAEQLLYAARLRGKVQWIQGGDKEGVILQQRPGAGMLVQIGSEVYLVVGPRGRPLQNPRQSKDDTYLYNAPNAISQMQQAPIQQSVPLRRVNPESKGTAPANQPSSLSIPPRTEQTLPAGISRDAMRVAWAWKGTLYVDHLANPGKAQLRRFRLSSDTPVAALAILDHGLLAVQYQNGRLELYDLNKNNERVLTREGQGSCAVVSSEVFLAYSCSNDESISVFEFTPEERINERKYGVNQASLLLPALSPRGHPAVATIAGTVLLYDSSAQGSALPVELAAPGLVQSVAFYDEGRVVVGGSFTGIRLLANHFSQEVVTGVKDIKLVTAKAPRLAFVADNGAKWLQLREVKRINRNGIVFLASGSALLLIYFIVPALRMYTEEKLQMRDEHVRRSLEYGATTAGQEEAPVLPLPTLPPDLVEACAEGTCVAYVGAGLSAQAGFPTWRPFVRGLLARVLQQGLIAPDFAKALQAAFEQGQTDLVADSLISALRGREALLNEYLQQVFLRADMRLPAAHRAMRDISFSAILTTNFDNLLERTFEDLQPHVYTHRDASRLLGALTRHEFFLLKLYGTLDQSDTVLVAPAQYGEAVAKNILFSQFMESLFFSRTILFVGASMEGIETYLTGISFRGTMPHPHYALVNVVGSAWRAKADVLERRYGIRILPYTAGPDFSEPVQFLEQLAQAVKAKTIAAKDVVREVARLKSITLHNLGPFEDLRIDLDEHWNILLGDNGVGKSTIMKAIAVAICGRDAKDYAGRLIRSGRDDAAITLETNQGKQYVTTILRKGSSAEVDTKPAPPMDVEGWLVLGFPPLRTMTWAREQEPPPSGIGRPMVDDVLPLAKGEIDPRLDKLKAWFVDLDHRIIDARIRQTSQSSTGKTRYEELRDDFFDVMREVTPGLKIEYAGVNLDTKEVLIKTDDGLVPIEAVSQGTTSLLGWVGILMERLYDVYVQRDGAGTQVASAIPPRARYALVLIDEIDAHMHPSWQRQIVHSLRGIFPNAQFVATTHSPLIVGGMPAEQVRRLVRDEEGKVVQLPVDQEWLMGRADQILTTQLFGMKTTVDPTTEENIAEYKTLLGKSGRTSEEERRFQDLRRVLRFRIPMSSETPVERRAQELLRALLQEQLGGQSLEAQQLVLQRAEKLFAELQSDTRSKA